MEKLKTEVCKNSFLLKKDCSFSGELPMGFDGMEKDKKEEVFFNLLYKQEKNSSESVFRNIVGRRECNPECVSSSLRIQIGQTLDSEYVDKNSDFLGSAESMAYKLFDCLYEAWTAYEIYKNKLEAKKIMNSNSVEENNVVSSNNNIHFINHEKQITLEIVDRIELDERFFSSSMLDSPGLLNQAIKSQFLPLAYKGKWREVPIFEHLSNTGQYIIGYSEKQNGKYPDLYFSCRTQEIDCSNPDNNLFSSPDFRTDKWIPKIGKVEIENVVNKIFQAFPDDRIEVDFEKIPKNPQNITELENGIINAFGKNELSDVFRFSFNSLVPGISKVLNAVIDLGKAQVHLGNFASFTVIEEPLVRIVQNMEKRLQRKKPELNCIQILSQNRMKENDSVDTFKVLFYNRPTSEVPKK